MKIDAKALVAPLVAALVLVLVVQATLGALKASDTWQPAAKIRVRPASPYAQLDQALSRPPVDSMPELRDPFAYASESASPTPKPGTVTRPKPTPGPVEPAPPPKPLLTSIIWDEDPRATVRWEGRDISVRENSLFADFMVKSIRPTEVVLERGGQTLVLKLGKKGD